MCNYILKITKYISLQIVFDLISVGCLATAPLLQEWVFDNGKGTSLSVLIGVIALYFLLLGGSSLAGYFSALFSFKGAIKFEKSLKQDYFSTIFRLSDRIFHEKPIGEYVSFQANDITALEQDYLQPLVSAIQSINRFVVYGFVLFYGIDWRIAVVILGTTVVTIMLTRVTDKPLVDKRAIYQEAVAKYTVKITDLLEGFCSINARTFDAISDQHGDSLNETAVKRLQYGKMKSLSIGVNELATGILRIAAFAVIVILFCTGEITVGAAIATLSYISAFIEPIDSLLYDFSTMLSMKKIKNNFISLVNRNVCSRKQVKKELNDCICFDNVCFQRGSFSLNNVNCRFEKGKKYAIVGPSGAGKSSLIKLLMGYENVDSGTIFIDGVDRNTLDLTELVSYIDQSEHVFMSNSEDNVTIFHAYPKENVEDILCCRNMERISNLYHRPNTPDCQKLSGGEKQIICFLRVLSKQTEVVLMDEPFSAVDTQSRKELEDFIFHSQAFRDHTVLMITHHSDPETLRQFDGVLHMENGTVVLKAN